MKGFTKVTESLDNMSGYKKTAILLGEIGPDASKQVLEILSLKTKQLRKIRKAMKSLGRFSYSDRKQFTEEMMVLTAVTRYGNAKGLLSDKPFSRTDKFIDSNRNEIKSMVNNNPDDIVKILKNWMGD